MLRVMVMEEDQRKLIKDVFGSSSESDDDHGVEGTHASYPSNLDEEPFSELPDRNPSCLPVAEINGLWLCRDFLSADQQLSLLSSIDNEGWFSGASHNQAMRFGDLPSWAVELSRSIREEICMGFLGHKVEDMGNCNNGESIMPSNLLWREPFFDQLICNVYQPGEGICAHVDLMRFEDGIAIVSLESPCVMHFSRAENVSSSSLQAEAAPTTTTTTKVPVYLTPGSLVIMWGEARYIWKHEINRKPGFQVWQGQEIDQKRRTSITLRKLCRKE